MMRATIHLTAADYATWLAGMTEAMRAWWLRVARPRRLDVVDLDDAPLPGAAAPAPPRFLSNWEAVLLVHARRTQVIAEEHRPEIFTSRKPHSDATFLVDGRVAGTWRAAHGDVALTSFAPIPVRFLRDLDDERRRLATWFAG